MKRRTCLCLAAALLLLSLPCGASQVDWSDWNEFNRDALDTPLVTTTSSLLFPSPEAFQGSYPENPGRLVHALPPLPLDMKTIDYLLAAYWMRIPEDAEAAAAYHNKGIRYVIDEDSYTENPSILIPAAIEIIGEAISDGTVVYAGGDEIEIEYHSDEGLVERVLLRITEDTVQPHALEAGHSVEAIYDAGTECALYLVKVNG